MKSWAGRCEERVLRSHAGMVKGVSVSWGFASPSLFVRNVNTVVLLPIRVLYLKSNRVSTGDITKIIGNLFRRPSNKTYARFCIRPTPPALYLMVSAVLYEKHYL